MTYEYLPDIATADIAFKARGKTLEELFNASAQATTHVMVENLEAVKPKEQREFKKRCDSLEMLLYHFLQEIVFYKDAEQLLLTSKKISIQQKDKDWEVKAQFVGERIDPERHHMNVDVKAVTMHQFNVFQMKNGWEAMVVLDI